MALTRDFRDTIWARAQRDPEFRKALLRGGIKCLFTGEIGVGMAILRDYTNAMIRFAK